MSSLQGLIVCRQLWLGLFPKTSTCLLGKRQMTNCWEGLLEDCLALAKFSSSHKIDVVSLAVSQPHHHQSLHLLQASVLVGKVTSGKQVQSSPSLVFLEPTSALKDSEQEEPADLPKPEKKKTRRDVLQSCFLASSDSILVEFLSSL